MYRLSPTIANFEAYRSLRNEVNKLVRSDREVHRKKLFASFKHCPKKFYRYMRTMSTANITVTKLVKPDSAEPTSTDEEAAEVLSESFKDVFTVEKDDPAGLPVFNKLSTHNPVIPVFFDSLTIRNKLNKLQCDKSAGPDGLHPMILNRCADAIAQPLASIFNKSFDTGVVPLDWKAANISPIFKKGSRMDPGNYRPVSLTSVVSKVMESIIKDDMVTILQKEGLLNTSQHGFMRKRSCLTNLLECFEEWTKALDEGYGIDVIYLDYRKAFDSVPHKRLIMKLKSYGFHSKTIMWIENFLSDRWMRVRVRESYSGWFEMISGVPQGSVLGPLLFLLYVNDLPHWIQNSMKMFADDTKIWQRLENDNDSSLLQADLQSLQSWSDRWLLRFNPDKCKVLHIGHKFTTSYKMSDNGVDKVLEEVSEEKDLGVFVTSDLKPSTQCIKAADKAQSVLRMIKRNFPKIDKEEFIILYKTYVRPHLEYCVQAWSPAMVKDIKVLEKVQQRATKWVKGLKKKSYAERLRILNLTTLEKRRKRGDLIEVYKILTGSEDIDSSTFFTVTSNEHGLRGHQYKLYKPSSHLNVRKNFFSQRVINDWNELPSFVVEAPSINSFKNRLDDHMADMDN